jgi:hypothetical protein
MFRKFALAFAVVAVVGGTFQGRLGAWNDASRTMFLTFSGPVRLPGVTLAAGSYIFEIANPMSTADVVLVRGRERQKTYYLGLTRPISRPSGARGDKPVTFGEAAKGEPVPITAWYPTGERTGREFLYSR